MEGELRYAIENYARSQEFKLSGIYTMDGSKRSNKANAFFTGFGKFKRIVLFDTLIKMHTVPELVAILAHEIGHYKKRHIFKTLGLSIGVSGVLFYTLSLILDHPELQVDFGVQQPSLHVGFVLASFLYAPVSRIFSFGMHALSRRHEFEADAYAVRTVRSGSALIDGLKKLTVENLGNLTPHWLKVKIDYTHPPVLERIGRIRQTGSE